MFKVGDFVKTSSGEIGIVQWTENRNMNIKPEDGYIGIDLLTHNRGFKAPVKGEECAKGSIDEAIGYYRNEAFRLNEIINKERIDKKELERLKDENKHLKQLLRLYI